MGKAWRESLGGKFIGFPCALLGLIPVYVPSVKDTPSGDVSFVKGVDCTRLPAALSTKVHARIAICIAIVHI